MWKTVDNRQIFVDKEVILGKSQRDYNIKAGLNTQSTRAKSDPISQPYPNPRQQK